jgi:hypothetical protein
MAGASGNGGAERWIGQLKGMSTTGHQACSCIAASMTHPQCRQVADARRPFPARMSTGRPHCMRQRHQRRTSRRAAGAQTNRSSSRRHRSGVVLARKSFLARFLGESPTAAPVHRAFVRRRARLPAGPPPRRGAQATRPCSSEPSYRTLPPQRSPNRLVVNNSSRCTCKGRLYGRDRQGTRGVRRPLGTDGTSRPPCPWSFFRAARVTAWRDQRPLTVVHKGRWNAPGRLGLNGPRSRTSKGRAPTTFASVERVPR